MNDYAERQYEGKGNNSQNEPIFKDDPPKKEHYIAAKPLVEAVNVALYLRRPLLLEGEAGCGKTRLAYSVAYELGYPLKECYIRSTSRAKDLLYTYDAVKRLYDIHEKKGKDDESLPPREEYATLGELGEAIELSQKDKPSVVLIDEIDKADIDFPNDLLLVLDRLWFTIDEAKEKGQKAPRYDALNGQERHERTHVLPLIIITSNREKELPKPFLRRCLFYYIEFPQKDKLEEIVNSHFPNRLSTETVDIAIKRFLQLRQQKQFSWRKRPSTSELLDWFLALERDEKQQGINIYQTLSTLTEGREFPHLEALVKNQSDRDKLKDLEIKNEQE